jgi:uridine phosphorylase
MSVNFNLNGKSVLVNSTGKPGGIGAPANAVAVRAA